MHLLAYWRWDNYVRDLDEGAGFNFNSKQSRLHTAIEPGETLWLFTCLKAPPRYYYLGLKVAHKCHEPFSNARRRQVSWPSLCPTPASCPTKSWAPYACAPRA